MVEVTIKTDFNENGQKRENVRKIAPCDMAFVACITPKGGGRIYHCNTGLVGGTGLDMCHVSGSLAEAAATVLMEWAGDSRERQTRVITAYMRHFTDKALEAAGAAVMGRPRSWL